MKICKKCGAHYSDDKIFCIDCNEKLSDKLSASEEQEMRENLNRQIEEMHNKRDPLYVSKFDKVIGWISLVGAATALAFVLIRMFTGQKIDFLLYSILFFLLSSVEALVPQISWELEKLRLSFTINGADYAEPSDYYLIGRKIAIISMAVIGIAALIISLF